MDWLIKNKYYHLVNVFLGLGYYQVTEDHIHTAIENRDVQMLKLLLSKTAPVFELKKPLEIYNQEILRILMDHAIFMPGWDILAGQSCPKVTKKLLAIFRID